MTETTVPRVARFADLRVGMTIERTYRHPSGTTDVRTGEIADLTRDVVNDSNHNWLAFVDDTRKEYVTLRILADPTPKPVPGWGALVRVIGGELDGKRAVAIARDWDYALCPWYAEGYGWASVGAIADWEVIHDPNSPKADAPTTDPLDEDDHRHRIDKHDHMVVRVGPDQWNNCGETPCGGQNLAWWSDHYGPLRFADEVTA